MEDGISNAEKDDSDTKARKKCPKCFHLFNCDKTYNLDAVEKLLLDNKDVIKRKLSFDIQLPISKSYFGLSKMSEICETTIPNLQMDFAIFVVHAHESRLSINEDNAGIGYAKIYRALLQATDGNVLIVIGGDDNYKNKDEEERSFISRWARRKVSSQFKEDFLDGKKSFVFSWNKKHRAIHEEALLHYLDPRMKGQKFEYQPKEHPTEHARGQESKTVNRENNEEEAHQYKEREATGNSPNIEITRGTPEMSIILEEGAESKRKDDITLPHDFVVVQERKDEFEVIDISEACNVADETETLLMKTRLRHGQVSYSTQDMVVWIEQWTPPNELLADIFNRFKNVAVADMQICRLEETGAIRVKITGTANNSVIYAIFEFLYSVITWIIDNAWQYFQRPAGSEAEIREPKQIKDSDEDFELV